MKSKKIKQPAESRAATAKASVPPPQSGELKWWHYAGGLAVFVIAAFILYSPAISGPFVFDDRYLPFMSPAAARFSMRVWTGVRPLLGLTYWASYKLAGTEPSAYHAFNVLFHAINSGLIFVVVRQLVDMAGESGGRRDLLALVAAVIFLAHPVQTESVAYVASRSETLSVCFALAALALYLHARRKGMRPMQTIAVLLLFVAAVTTKEHTMALPLVFLVTDLFWSGVDGLKRNRMLYAGLFAGGLVGGVFVWNVLKTSPVIGFGAGNLHWYQYLFTQFRSVCIYLRLYVLPVGLNLDYDMPPSLSIFGHLAIVWGAVLAGLGYLAWKYRKEYPLAAYGYAVFLILLAPTSSIVPIRDVIAERRLYLPMIGLLLITVDLIRRLTWPSSRYGLLAVVLLAVLGAAAYARNGVWSDNVTLWRDTVAKSPEKLRPRLQLATALMETGECSTAASEYQAANKLKPDDFEALYNWAYALDCAGQTDDALAKLREAERIEHPASLYASMGMMLGKRQRNDEALAALERAVAADPNFAMTYVYRGNVYMQLGDTTRAIAEYRTAVAKDGNNETARQALAMAERRLQQTVR